MRKFTKKALSLAVASFVSVTSVFTGDITSTFGSTVSILAATEQATYQVKFNAPSTWSSNVYAYAYYDQTNAGVTDKIEPLGYWPGTKATKNTDGTYSASVNTNIGSVKVIFADITGEVGTVLKQGTDGKYYECTTASQLPTGWQKDANGNVITDAEGNYKAAEGYVITSDSYIDGTTDKITSLATASPVPTVEATATVAPTAVPTVEPVEGPQVKVSVANGTSYSEQKSDTLPVTISLENGATSATYSIDNGTKKVITKDTIVKVGEGKIANSSVTLKVESTDGETTNTQTFTYFKSADAAKTVSVSKSMLKIFATVENASEFKKVIPVHFTVPASDWDTNGASVYCYAYYDVQTSNGVVTKKPLDIWPGTKMEKDSTGTYTVNLPTTSGDVKVMFVSIIGSKGQHYAEGTTLPDGTTCSEEFYMCNELHKLPYGYSGTDKYGNAIPNEGIRVTDETWISYDSVSSSEQDAKLKVDKTVPVTENPSFVDPYSATATPKVTATPVPEMTGYFGANLSAPQSKDAKLTLSAVAKNAKAAVTYSFSVDGTEIYSGKNDSTPWDASKLEDGTHTIAVSMTDGKTTVNAEKNFTINSTDDVLATATPAVATTPAVTATATPVVATTPAITAAVEPSATPIVTVSPDPTAMPFVLNVSYDKKNKTAGEKIKVKASVVDYPEVVKYSFVVKKGSTSKKLQSKKTKTTVNWTPTASGTYKVLVYAYTEEGRLIAKTTSSYKVAKRIINIKSISPAKVKKGKKTTVTIKTSVTKKYKSKFQVKAVIKNSKSKKVATKKYSKKTKFNVKLTKKGTYTVTITGKVGSRTVTVTKKLVVK